MCLPLQLVDDSTTLDKAKICFPRGNCREKLFKNGLIAKFNIDTTWNEEQITSEICDLFKNCFPVENEFGFCYLTTYPGVKMLVQPKVNTSFIWDAKAVLSIHRSTIHILSNLNHDCFSNDISSGEAHEVSAVWSFEEQFLIKTVEVFYIMPNLSKSGFVLQSFHWNGFCSCTTGTIQPLQYKICQNLPPLSTNQRAKRDSF